ncbi:MAG TPA: DUF192 domain-containing protein [Anaerolineae bacterium]|nr:DUF192 domain-containing protein [Anaerolineae bacterium]
MSIRVENLSRGQILVTSGRAADTYWSSLRGLIGSQPLAQGEGLLIVPCNSVHTHFMSFPIDVLYVDRDDRVVAMNHSMAPWRFGRLHRQAHFVIELPAGTLGRSGTEVGDQLQVLGRAI